MNYETPQQVDSPEGLYFYHTMQFPDGEVIQGDWDLRPALDKYLGNQNFEGKRCLDIGTATGCLSFAMERAGASEVVSFDQSVDHGFDLLPDWKGHDDGSVERMKKAYWYCHRKLGSKAKVIYGDIYHLPLGMHGYDYAVIASILLHLKSPVSVIEELFWRAKRIIITDVHRPYYDSKNPGMIFRPAYPDNRNDFLYWWYIPMATVVNMLESYGMTIESAYTFTAGGRACGDTQYYCVVAKSV